MISVLRRGEGMKETTVLNRISNLVNNINYKSLYVEIKTENDKYVLEKENDLKVIGFEGEKRNINEH